MSEPQGIEDEPVKVIVTWTQETYKAREDELKLKSASLEAKYTSLLADWKAFEAMMNDTFAKLPKQDVMYFDSPLSPLRLMSNVRFNLVKLGWRWAGQSVSLPETIKKFSVAVSDALRWSKGVMNDHERSLNEFMVQEQIKAKQVRPPKDVRGE